MRKTDLRLFRRIANRCFCNGAIFSVFFLLAACSSPENISCQYEKYVQELERSVKQKPLDFALRFKLGRFYYQFHDYEKAKNTLAGVQEKEARALLAKAFVRLKDYTPALELFEHLGENEADDEYMYLYASTLEEKNLFGPAVKLYKKIKGGFAQAAETRIKEIGVRVEEGVPEQIRHVLDKEKDFLAGIKDDAAAILFVDEEMQIHENNTSVSILHVAQKVLKEKGKEIAEVQLGYDSTYERIELEYARTITPDNNVVYAGKESIRDVSKYLNFPLYSNAKTFIISMPAVDVGSIIEYKVKIYSSKLVNKNDFSLNYRLREEYPVASAHFKLLIPKAREIKLKFFNEEYAQGIPLVPQVSETALQKIYSWRFEHIAPIIPEEKMPPLAEVNPAVSITSFSSWDEVYAWWQEMFQGKTTLTPSVKAAVAELIRDCKTDQEKARKIYEFCVRDIRYVGVEYGESGYEPHPASDIFVNRYGDCKDKATLLVAMLREAGLKAYPVLIPTRGMYPVSPDFPTIQFNHAIAAIELDGKLIFMDGTAMTTSFGDLPLDDQERQVLVFFDDHYMLLTTPVIKENVIAYTMNIVLDAQEDALIQREVGVSGYFAAYQRYYLKYTHPQHIRDNIQQRMMQISPFTQLIDYQIENVDDFSKSPVLKYSFSAKKLLNPARHLRMIPYLGDIEIDAGYASKDKRVFPVEFEGLSCYISRVTVTLPLGLHVMYLPQNQDIVTKWFEFKASYTQDKNTLGFYREFSIHNRRVEQEEYHLFKEQLEKVTYLLREEVILEKGEGAENGQRGSRQSKGHSR